MKIQKKGWMLVAFLGIFFLGACESVSPAEQGKDGDYPLSAEDARKQKQGKIFGDGLEFFGGGKSSGRDEESGNGIGVNSILWRAALDTVSFMPIASADPFGGVIITDWYENAGAKGERYKLNVLISDRRLSSTSLKVTAFKQRQARGNWQDVPVDAEFARDIEDKILTRARELRVQRLAE